MKDRVVLINHGNKEGLFGLVGGYSVKPWFIEVIICDPMEQRERTCGVLFITPFRILKGMMNAL